MFPEELEHAFQLQKTFKFEASHQLVHHDGKCSRLHGHSFTLSVELSAEALQKGGPGSNMVCDFGTVSKIVKPLLESHLDHYHLNESLNTDSPTAEFIAKWVYERLEKDLPHLSAVLIKETTSSVAIYRPRRKRGQCCCDCHEKRDGTEFRLGENGVLENGNGISKNGNWISENGNRISENGNRILENGNHEQIEH